MKGAVKVLSKHMAKELGLRRIAVNVVAPGAVATDFSGGIVRDTPAVNKMLAEATALGPAGIPDDIGPMIVLLLSEENRWVNAHASRLREVWRFSYPYRHLRSWSHKGAKRG